MVLPNSPRASRRSARWCFERFFRELGPLHEIFAVGRLNCNIEPFCSDNFLFAPRLNLFVHRSDRARRATFEYYQVRGQEIGFAAALVLSFRLELHIPFCRLR